MSSQDYETEQVFKSITRAKEDIFDSDEPLYTELTDNHINKLSIIPSIYIPMHLCAHILTMEIVVSLYTKIHISTQKYSINNIIHMHTHIFV